jgi:CRP/FNR family transcriptional regulator, cyclic AMP receptor protein
MTKPNDLMHIMSTLLFLKKTDLFKDIPSDYLSTVVKLMQEKSYLKEEVLFKKGDLGNEFFIIKEGAIEIQLPQGNVTLTQGQGIGEMSLLDGEARSATVVIKEDSTLLCLQSKTFNQLLNSYPSIAKSMLRMLSLRLREKN